MSREIETDGFITRQEDLKGSEPKIDWEAQEYGNELYKLIPPPFGQVVITGMGLVLMCKGTYKMLSERKDYIEVDNADLQNSLDADGYTASRSR